MEECMAEIKKIPCELDKDSIAFLEERLGAKINPQIETEKDYYRNIFYFKCCALQNENITGGTAGENFTIRDCFSHKEKADILFENVYAHALEFQDLTVKVSSVTDPQQLETLMMDFMQHSESGMAAQTATLNEFLTPKLHIINDDGRDIGNAQILRTFNAQQLSGYFHAFPDLEKDMNEKYHDMVVKARAEIAPLLPKDARKEDYFAVTAEHPKAVLALAIIAQKQAESNGTTISVSSPQDLAEKCQHPTVVALADKISFNDLAESLKTAYVAVRPCNDFANKNETPFRMAQAKAGREY